MSSHGLRHEDLRILSEGSLWQEIITLTDSMTTMELSVSGFAFFRGMALIKSGRPDEGVLEIDRGLRLEPTSRWGNKLLFDALLANGHIHLAFSKFAEFIGAGDDRESEKTWYIQHAVELDLFDLASDMNARRKVISEVPPRPKFALGIQCFCKADTLEQVFSSVCKLESAHDFALVILQDNELMSSNPEKYVSGRRRVEAIISSWLPQLSRAYFSVEYFLNKYNCGTAPTCRRLIDHICATYDGFLFIEDDCILAPSALEWAAFHLKSTISQTGPWFVTCESSFFDKEDRSLDSELQEALVKIASYNSIKNAYVLNKFVNSTCFGTSSAIWKLCAAARSFTRGPESLNRLVAAKGKTTVAPVVPRAADIGMQHELGYSVSTVGQNNVTEKKGTYLLSSTVFDPGGCAEFGGDKDLLFRASSKLDLAAIRLVEARYGD